MIEQDNLKNIELEGQESGWTKTLPNSPNYHILQPHQCNVLSLLLTCLWFWVAKVKGKPSNKKSDLIWFFS